MLIKTYFAEEAQRLSSKKMDSIARCYQEIFNYTFPEENWTQASALQEIRKNFVCTFNRLPVVADMVLKDSDQTIGLAWGILVDQANIKIDDMPFGLDEKDALAGIEAYRYWLKNFTQQEKILIFKEIGVLPKYQGRNVTALAKIILDKASQFHYEAVLCWTSPYSAVFYLAPGIHWHPVHFFPKNNRVVLGGLTKSSLKVVNTGLDDEKNIGWLKIHQRVEDIFTPRALKKLSQSKR